jgi:ribosomal protein S18 acetylase RimI-like enzyme
VSTQESPDVILREMRPGEEAFVVALTVSIWADVSTAKNITDRFGPLNGHLWTEHKADQILAELNKAEIVLIAERDREIVGFATLLYDTKYGIGAVGHLGVANGLQNKGLGRRLLRTALERFRRDGLKYARIDALVQNERAIHLYESEGFSEVGRSVHLFQPLT